MQFRGECQSRGDAAQLRGARQGVWLSPGGGRGYFFGSLFLAAGFSPELVFCPGAAAADAVSAGAPLIPAARDVGAPFWGPLTPPFAPGDLFPYQEEYSNELRNSFSSPHVLQRPWLTAPFGGSITQW